MSYIQGIERNQSLLFPELVEDYVEENNSVRFIDAYVDTLDLRELGFTHAQTTATGRPPYCPADLLKLYVYGYLNKVRSSRLLEQQTHRNIEVMWLLRKLQPDFKTIADFRKNNTEGLKKVCREFTLLCKKLNLFGGELVAIDGSKFSAVNHDSRTYTKKKLQRLLKEIDEKIETYFGQVDSADMAESTVAVRETPHVLREHIAQLQKHKAELEELQKTLNNSNETQISLTDPDSRLMTTGKHGNDVCYNVQIAVDSKYKLIVTHDLTNEANDLHQLYPMAQSAKEVLGVEHLDATADKGYYNETQIAQCEQENISCYIPEPEKSQNKALGLYTDRDFRYDATSDCYICPANEQLTKRSETIKGKKQTGVYATSACQGCRLRSQCTRSKRSGRRIYRWVNKHVIEEMRKRMAHYPEKARQRKEIVEHPFGTLKHGMNHGYFLLRGIKKVAAEFSMSVLVYNMKRVLNIMGVATLIAALRAMTMTILSFLAHLVIPRIQFANRRCLVN